MNKDKSHSHDHSEASRSESSENPAFWRSPEHRLGQASFPTERDFEYTPTTQEIQETQEGLSRRKFLGFLGATAALAGSAGCIRKPVENILPYAIRPEEIVPGKPIFYATAMNLGDSVLGLLVESQEGRPTKVEGNPEHPTSFGSTHVWAQSAALDIYDPDRSQVPHKKTLRKKVAAAAAHGHGAKKSTGPTWKEALDALRAQVEKAKAKNGGGFALLTGASPSPSFHALLTDLKKKLPDLQIFQDDPTGTPFTKEGLRLLGVADQKQTLALHKADIIVSLEHDFLGSEGESTRQSRLFSLRRKADDSMNRLYVIENQFSSTGTSADHRLRLQSSQVGEFLACLATRLLEDKKIELPAAISGLAGPLKNRAAVALKAHDSKFAKWIQVLADDLAGKKGKAALLVGECQPPRVHALAHLLNVLLGNVGADKPIQFVPALQEAPAGNLQDLAKAIQNKQIESLVILGGNPAYTAPADLDFASLLKQIPYTLHHGLYFDETARKATWHLPASHFLEAWGDLQSFDGTVSIQQPLIAPLYNTVSHLELVAFLSGASETEGHKIVQGYWKAKAPALSFESDWRTWLHDGVQTLHRRPAGKPSFLWDGLSKAWSGVSETIAVSDFEILFSLDSKILDGRFANNAWLQELPDPMSKLTWDNAALVSPKTAAKYQLQNGEFIEIKLQGRKLTLPIFTTPGLAEQTLVLPLGYGRKHGGRIALGAGFNVYPLRSSSTPYIAKGATIQKVARPRYELASTQEHGRLEEPITGKRRDAIFRSTSLSQFKKEPKFVEKFELMPAKKLKSLWKEPNEGGGHQWGMVIDLHSCTGCNVCTVACQAENNISIVGKERVLVGREMHWIRLDRYFTGDVDDPEAVFQPVGCVHCETAPCENVCPVAATAHSPDGMNDMAYNRCIGTRYCANNCPYKVRRFNFFNFAKENDETLPTLKMQRNPDVTVRFRGVMEKCSYCVQRVSAAKIYAKAYTDGVVPDAYAQTKTSPEGVELFTAQHDEVALPACAQACPSHAITFGDINNPKSRVSQLKNDPRNYAVLAELNIKPRTTYLARIYNRNPKLA